MLARSFRGFQAATHRNTAKPKQYVQVVASQAVQSTAAFTILSFSERINFIFLFPLG